MTILHDINEDMVSRVDTCIAKAEKPPEWLFRSFVDYLFQEKRDGIDGLHHATSGLAGEAGECLDLTKKCWVYGRPVDEVTFDKLMEEAGDTIHYMQMLLIKLSEIGGEHLTLNDLMLNNMVKLRKRYPNGFSKEAAIARADKLGPGGPSGLVKYDTEHTPG